MVQVKVFTFNSVGENTYLLYDETGEAAIIDCGCMSSAEQQKLLDYCTEHQLSPRLLLNTHLHFDHCWGNPWAMHQWELKPHCHSRELTDQPSPSEQCRNFGLNVRFEDVPQEAYQLLKQGDRLQFGATELEVREVPGHSPGHIVFYCEAGGFVIAGDTLFYEDIGRTDLWGGNYDQLVMGIKEQMLTLPEATIVYSGHGDSTTIAHEKQFNSYLR